jgi:hypothetical protein
MTQPFDVMISYSSTDVDVVRRLVERLKHDGIRVWFDKDQMAGGVPLVVQLADAVDACRHLIACLSDDYIGRDWGTAELQQSLTRDPAGRAGRTIPVRIRPLTVEIPNMISHLHIPDLSDPLHFDEPYWAIVEQLRRSREHGRPEIGRDEAAAAAEEAFARRSGPAVTLFKVRGATLSLVKVLYQEGIGSPPADGTLDRLVDGLVMQVALPNEIKAALATLNAFGRHVAQDSTAQLDTAPALDALRRLHGWTFPQQVSTEVWDSLPMVGLTERQIPDTAYRIRGPALDQLRLGPLYAGHDDHERDAVLVNLVTLPGIDEPRFFESVSRLRRLGGANLVTPRNAGSVVIDGQRRCPFVVLPSFEGISLRELMSKHGPIPLTAAVDACLGIGTALMRLHDMEPATVHGDIRPASVRVGPYGSVSVLCVGHPVVTADADRTRLADGDLELFPPSDPDPGLTPGADVRALGAILACLLTGQPGDLEPDLAAADDEIRAFVERLSAARTAREACDLLRSVRPVASPRDDALEQVVRRHLPVNEWSGQLAPGRLRQVDTAPVAARLAWPLDESAVLVWEVGTDALAVVRGRDLVWRDDEAIPVRRTVAGPGHRLAVGGWNGEVRWFEGAALVVRAKLDGPVGDLTFVGDDLVAGSWHRQLRRFRPDATVVDLLPVDRGVHRIAAADHSGRFAVVDLVGGIAVYSGQERVATVQPAGPVADAAYAGGRLVLLGDEDIHSVWLDGSRSAPVASPGASALHPLPEPGQCLLVVTGDGPHAAPAVQVWRIDEAERRQAAFTLSPGQEILSLSSDGARVTVALPSGGCAFVRQGVEVMRWSDAVSAHVSGDGRRIAVCRPGRVELFEDPT